MKEKSLRRFHRDLGIILAVFIIAQAGSGLFITLERSWGAGKGMRTPSSMKTKITALSLMKAMSMRPRRNSEKRPKAGKVRLKSSLNRRTLEADLSAISTVSCRRRAF